MKKSDKKRTIFADRNINNPEFDSGYIIEIILCSHVSTRTKYLQNMRQTHIIPQN